MDSAQQLVQSLHRISAKFLLVVSALLVLGACASNRTELGLIGSNQEIPMPSFYARNDSASGDLPSFAQIRVYELTGDCKLPDCPIVWDVVVSEKHAPNEFVYGGFPGFGSQTVIPAKPLVPQKRYLLVTVPDVYGTPDGHGSYHFRVTPEGRVVEDK